MEVLRLAPEESVFAHLYFHPLSREPSPALWRVALVVRPSDNLFPVVGLGPRTDVQGPSSLVISHREREARLKAGLPPCFRDDLPTAGAVAEKHEKVLVGDKFVFPEPGGECLRFWAGCTRQSLNYFDYLHFFLLDLPIHA